MSTSETFWTALHAGDLDRVSAHLERNPALATTPLSPGGLAAPDRPLLPAARDCRSPPGPCPGTRCVRGVGPGGCGPVGSDPGREPQRGRGVRPGRLLSPGTCCILWPGRGRSPPPGARSESRGGRRQCDADHRAPRGRSLRQHRPGCRTAQGRGRPQCRPAGGRDRAPRGGASRQPGHGPRPAGRGSRFPGHHRRRKDRALVRPGGRTRRGGGAALKPVS